MKLWGSVKQGANKLAFETEKALRVKRQESAITGLRDRVQAQYAELGQAAFSLMDEGALTHPQLAQYANTIVTLQDQIKEEASKLAVMQAEEFESETDAVQAGPQPVEPVAASGPAVETPAAEPPAPPPPPPAE